MYDTERQVKRDKEKICGRKRKCEKCSERGTERETTQKFQSS